MLVAAAEGPASPAGGCLTMEPGPILIVDDEQLILGTVAEILDLEGYRTECARNGAEALEAVLRCRPSLILLDMNMPVLDGWGVARELRRLGIAIPIVVMTAGQSAPLAAKEISAAGYLSKPFDLFELVACIEEVHGSTGDGAGTV